MTDKPSDDVVLRVRNDGLGDRIICVVARDVLSLDGRAVGLDGFLMTMWQARWLMLAFILVFGLMALTYSYVATQWYEAKTVLAPVSKDDVGGLANKLGSLSMLTGLAGINFGEGNNTDESLGVLKSHDFARQFIEDQNLTHVFLWKDWDAKFNRWKEANPEKQPDIRDAIRYFDKNVLLVDVDKQTGLVTVGIRWKNPVLAASWANLIIDRLNAQMRQRALTEGNQNIEFLQKEMSTTRQLSLQVAIAQVIETELQKVMIANSTREFAFRIIDHAEVPKIRSWPNRKIVTAVGILAGGLAGLLASLVRDLLKRRARSVESTE